MEAGSTCSYAMPPSQSCQSPDVMFTPLDSDLKSLNLAVVGHQEWVTFLEVDELPRPGRIGRASRDLEEPAGAGAVVAVQLARLTGRRVLFFTALGRDSIGERSEQRLKELGVEPVVAWREQPSRRGISLVDPGGDPDVAATLAGIMQGAGYALPVTPDSNNLTSMSKQRAAGAIGTVKITQVDSEGKPLETWTLWNAFAQEINFGGTLAYGNDELTEYTLKVRYDWAQLETASEGSSIVVPNENLFFDISR